MPGKDEALKSSEVLSEDLTSVDSGRSWSVSQQYAWRAANFTVVAGSTTLCILAVQSPMKTMLVNLSRQRPIMPISNAGIFGVAKLLYAGTLSMLGGSFLRTSWNSVARESSKVTDGTFAKEGSTITDQTLSAELSESAIGLLAREAALEDKIARGQKVIGMSLGEMLLTNYSESLSTLRKVPDLLPADFRPGTMHNASRLIAGGFAPRFCSGLINMTSLCILEEKLASMMLSIEDDGTRHFASGALSGMTGAFFSYPFALFKDYVQVQSEVKNGKLYNKGAFTSAKELYATFQVNPLNSLKNFGIMSAKQLPMRLFLTGTIFGIIGGVGGRLGSEPLSAVVPVEFQPPSPGRARVGFFASGEISNTAVTDASEEIGPTPVRMK
jgi:hypothetical protein